MDIEDVKAEVGILLTDMQNQPEDRHEVYLKLMEKLNEMRAFGMPLPADLLQMEKSLEAEFAADTNPDDGDAEHG